MDYNLSDLGSQYHCLCNGHKTDGHGMPSISRQPAATSLPVPKLHPPHSNDITKYVMDTGSNIMCRPRLELKSIMRSKLRSSKLSKLRPFIMLELRPRLAQHGTTHFSLGVSYGLSFASGGRSSLLTLHGRDVPHIGGSVSLRSASLGSASLGQ
jgi:hypothetical protein